MMTIGMMASLTEFRFGRKKLLFLLAIYGIWVVCSSMFLIYIGGELLLIRLFYFTISIPAAVLTYWAANDSPVQSVFNHMTQILFSVLMASILRVFTEHLGLSGSANILLMGIFYCAIIYLEYRFLRQPFRMLIQAIPTRWGILTLIPCVFCGYLIFVASWPDSYLKNPSQMAYVYATVIPLIIVYIVVFKSLYDLYHIHMEQHRSSLMAVQITALKDKIQKVKDVEEEVRIQRHDLRHQLQVVAELVTRDETETALEFLNATQKRLDEQKETLWCRPPVLNAVFSSYFDQARNQGIAVETEISLPDDLPVDEGELAIVLANALENAIHANLLYPYEQRKLRCKMIGTPSIMLEISNPCMGDIIFDSNGLPVAQRKGHGRGVQSISAFCQKNGAVCQFDLIDGWFRFR